ncbi:MAG: methyltransferase domain-containing protein [Mesorhizobium sp.]|nr:methyltransferase domain-containing protein [Mesorhizobium sp.]MBN9245289.1 methyltransferase domain-containing protein [Mesorhizobium sp.]
MTELRDGELSEIERRYARRNAQGKANLYDPLLPVNIAFRQEREKVLAKTLRALLGERPISSLRILEIGCGGGRNLVDFIGWGALPGNCTGNELLSERVEVARRNLPPTVTIVQGDASSLDFADGSFDIILQSTVFSSILDKELRSAVANNMWRMLAKDGGIIWYDFTMDNPRNADVAGIKQAEIRSLFPQARYDATKTTLAPPIARRVTKLSPGLYSLLNTLPFLRTHVVALLRK